MAAMVEVGQAGGREVAMTVRDPTSHPFYVSALAVAIVLIIAILVVSLAWH
jgi:hypothetical protein